MSKERKSRSKPAVIPVQIVPQGDPFRSIVQDIMSPQEKPEPPKTRAVMLRLKPYLYESLRACADVSGESVPRLSIRLLEVALEKYAAALVAEMPELKSPSDSKLLSPFDFQSYFQAFPDEEPEGDE